MTDDPARRRRSLIDDVVGGGLSFLIELGVVVALGAITLVIAWLALALV